MGLVKIFMMVS